MASWIQKFVWIATLPSICTQRCSRYLTKLIFSVCTVKKKKPRFFRFPVGQQILAKNSTLVSKRYLYFEKSITMFGQKAHFIKCMEHSPKTYFQNKLERKIRSWTWLVRSICTSKKYDHFWSKGLFWLNLWKHIFKTNSLIDQTNFPCTCS